MEQVITETVKQVPALGVLAAVVWMFLRQMSEARAEYLSTIRDTRDVILENTKVTRETGEAIVSLTEVVRHFEGKK